MSKGAIIFAHNNAEIDYIKIAATNALMIKHNLDISVSLITDEGTIGWAKKSLGQELLDECFDNIILSEKEYVYSQNNQKIFRDTNYSTKQLGFYNCDHWMAYDLSPYDETLFIDADYLIMSDSLNNVWGSSNDFMINHSVEEVLAERNGIDTSLDDFGIKLYWATAIYFKKTELSEHVFSLVKHIYDNYQYYRQLYMIPRGLFRNDFAFSIAVHMINGFSDQGLIKELPCPPLQKSFDKDDVYSVNGINDLTLLLEKTDRVGEFIAHRIKNVDIHLMNKYAVGRQTDQLISLYRK